MEINNDIDIDSLLLQQFSSMATQDRDVLIADLQKLLGDQLNAEGCAFFLDMNNWNLQAAVCSYFECQQDIPSTTLPNMSVISDSSVPETLTAPPNSDFKKTWRIINSGNQTWPPGCCLRFVSGSQMTMHDRVMVDALSPSCAAEINLELTCPPQEGSYKGEWRMSTITGTYFGEYLLVAVNVRVGSDSLAAQVPMASVGPFINASKMDDEDGGQIWGTQCFTPQMAGFPASVHAVSNSMFPNNTTVQSPESLRRLAMLHGTTCETDADTMETS